MAEPNQLYNFGRVHHKGQVCEIIVNFGSLVQEEKLFKGISYLELLRIHFSVEWNHLCKIGRRHIGDSSVKLTCFWASCSGGNSVKRSFLARALAVILFKRVEHLVTNLKA